MKKMLMAGLLAGVLVGLLASCASTSVVAHWEKEGYQTPGFKKILVAAVFKQEVVRRSLEDEFLAQMAKLGPMAIRSYTLLPDPEKETKESVIAAVKETGADACLVVRLVKVDSKTTYTPGYVEPSYDGYGAYWSYAWYNGYYVPPMSYEFDIVTVDVKLFDAQTSELVWAVSTETVDPHSTQKEIKALVKVILQAMQKDHLL